MTNSFLSAVQNKLADNILSMKPEEIDQTIAKFAYAVRANDKYFDSSGGTVKISDKNLKKTLNLGKKRKISWSND